MVTANRKVFSIVLIAAGIIALVFGVVFIAQGFMKSSLISDAMQMEKASYGSADGEIDGVIDTSSEAQVMAGVLRDHRMENFGYYTELERDDPNRATILSAMTMENSLNLAVLGYGVTDIAKASGGFMLVIGLALTFSGIFIARSRKISLE